MSTRWAVARADRERTGLWRQSSKTSHAFPVVFVLESTAHADLVCPVTVGISHRESKLMLASNKQL